MDGKASLLQQTLELSGWPVVHRGPRIHRLVEDVGKPPFVRWGAIDVLDEESTTGGKDREQLIDQWPNRLCGDVVDDVQHVGGIEVLRTSEIHHISKAVLDIR